MLTWLLLAAAGFAAGVINAIAGGGSLISVPALLHTGISALIVSPQEPSALVATEAAAHIEAAIDRYLHRQLKWELSTSAKPMFVGDVR